MKNIEKSPVIRDRWAKFDKKHRKKPGNTCVYQKKVVILQPNLNYNKINRNYRYLYYNIDYTMSKGTIATHLPRKAEQNLRIVGEQIRLARLRRDLTIAQIAERATCSELTVMRVERGVPTVAIGIYLRVLFALGLDESILFLAKDDEVGRTLQDLDLRHRQRASKRE